MGVVEESDPGCQITVTQKTISMFDKFDLQVE
jgi:hypothetical protein